MIFKKPTSTSPLLLLLLAIVLTCVVIMVKCTPKGLMSVALLNFQICSIDNTYTYVSHYPKSDCLIVQSFLPPQTVETPHQWPVHP